MEGKKELEVLRLGIMGVALPGLAWVGNLGSEEELEIVSY